jgi:hypothetical protein
MEEKNINKPTQKKTKTTTTKRRVQDITSAERLKRVDEVEQLIIQGANRKEIIKFCQGKYKVKENTTDLYIHDAKENIKENFKRMYDKDYFEANLFQRLEDLYKQSYDLEDFKECRVLLKDLRDLLGIAPQKIDVTTNGETINTTPTITFKKFEE